MALSPSLASLVVLLAWFTDRLLGEPPARLHPVIWMGTYLRAARRRSAPTLVAGVLAWGAGAVTVLLVSGTAQWLLSVLVGRGLTGYVATIVLGAIALKPLFAWRALRQAGEAVRAAPDLAAARQALGWDLVSRDTSELSAGEVYGATIESLAENLSDSLVAPLLCFVIGGLPLAALYRYANTADAMWGYHTPALERFGKWAARFDDVLNFIPARLTALLLLVACPLAGGDASAALRLWMRDARRTASPNAGQPMSTISGALGVQLSKRGHYCLGAEFPEPSSADVPRALRLCETAAWLAVGVFAGLLIVWGAPWKS
jgi:adenosylcobinamide-phosphate synthase